MPERRIHIERLVVRLHGVSEATGQQVANGLGEAVARTVSERVSAGGAVSSLDIGSVSVPRAADAPAITSAVGRALGARLDGKRS